MLKKGTLINLKTKTRQTAKRPTTKLRQDDERNMKGKNMKGKNMNIDQMIARNVAGITESNIVVEGDKENSNSRLQVLLPNGNSSMIGKTGKESPPAKMETTTTNKIEDGTANTDHPATPTQLSYDSEHWISPLLSESGTESSPPTEELQEGRNGRTNSMDDLIASFLGVAIQQATVICSCHAKVYRGKELVTMGWEWIKLEKYDANGKFALAVRNMNGTVLNMPIAHGMPGGLQRQRQSNKSGIFLTHMLQDGEHEVVKIITNNDDHEELHEILRQIIIIGNTNP